MPVPPRRSRRIALSVSASTRGRPIGLPLLVPFAAALRMPAITRSESRLASCFAWPWWRARQQDPPNHLVIGTEVRLGVAVECHAVGIQPLEVMDRRHHTLAAKAVERPEQHAIELAAAGVLE